MATLSGTVKFFSAKRGYGFIIPDDPEQDGEEYFVHHSVIIGEGFRSLATGEEVQFEVDKDATTHKLVAINVTGPDGNPVQNKPHQPKGSGKGKDGGKEGGGKGKGREKGEAKGKSDDGKGGSMAVKGKGKAIEASYKGGWDDGYDMKGSGKYGGGYRDGGKYGGGKGYKGFDAYDAYGYDDWGFKGGYGKGYSKGYDDYGYKGGGKMGKGGYGKGYKGDYYDDYDYDDYGYKGGYKGKSAGGFKGASKGKDSYKGGGFGDYGGFKGGGKGKGKYDY